jgi:hypothetical protein
VGYFHWDVVAFGPPWPSGRGRRSTSFGIECRSGFMRSVGWRWSISASSEYHRQRGSGRRPPLATADVGRRMTGGAASSVREGGSASGCARTGRVARPRVLLGQASAAGLRERERERMTARDWAAHCWAELREKRRSGPSCSFVFLFQKCK